MVRLSLFFLFWHTLNISNGTLEYTGTANVSTKSNGNNKLIERTFLIGSIIAAIAAVMLGSQLYDYYLEKTYPKSDLYGRWVEQDVAFYAANEFVLNGAGVSVDGGVVATQFYWDGTYLKFNVGGKEHRFQALNEAFSEMKQISEPNYQPIYRVREIQK